MSIFILLGYWTFLKLMCHITGVDSFSEMCTSNCHLSYTFANVKFFAVLCFGFFYGCLFSAPQNFYNDTNLSLFLYSVQISCLLKSVSNTSILKMKLRNKITGHYVQRGTWNTVGTQRTFLLNLLFILFFPSSSPHHSEWG